MAANHNGTAAHVERIDLDDRDRMVVDDHARGTTGATRTSTPMRLSP